MLSYISTQLYSEDFSISNWLTFLQKLVKNFIFHFSRQNHARKVRMKNEGFHCCRYKVKNCVYSEMQIDQAME